MGDEQAVVGGVDEEDDVVETELEPLQVYHDDDEMCQWNRLEDQGRECFLFLKGSIKGFFYLECHNKIKTLSFVNLFS